MKAIVYYRVGNDRATRKTRSVKLWSLLVRLWQRVINLLHLSRD